MCILSHLPPHQNKNVSEGRGQNGAHGLKYIYLP